MAEKVETSSDGTAGQLRLAPILAIALVVVFGGMWVLTSGLRHPLKDDEVQLWGTVVYFHDPGHFAEAIRDNRCAMGPLSSVLWVLVSQWQDYDPRWMRMLTAVFAVIVLISAWSLLASATGAKHGGSPCSGNRSSPLLWWFLILVLPPAFILYFAVMSDVMMWAFVVTSYVWLKKRDFSLGSCIGAGFLFGIACLGRVWAMPVAFAIAAVVWLRRRQWRGVWLVAPSLLSCGLLWSLWGGLTPPSVQHVYKPMFAPLSVTHSIALVGMFVFPALCYRWEAPRIRNTVIASGVGGVIAGLLCEVLLIETMRGVGSHGGFIASGFTWLEDCSGLPAASLLWSLFCGLGTAVLVRLGLESHADERLTPSALFAGAVVLLLPLALVRFYAERYAIPTIMLSIVCAGMVMTPKHAIRHGAVAWWTSYVSCAVMNTVMVLLCLGFITKGIIGAEDKQQRFIAWQGNAEDTLREIALRGAEKELPRGDAEISLEKFYTQ